MNEILTHGGKKETYEEFIDKFKEKHTTDECYTPAEVYDTICSYFCERFKIDPATVARPFWPGGDYENFNYAGRVVIDNPPFSILSKIVKFYTNKNIPFILFAPTITIHGMDNQNIGAIITRASITYENGAKVATSFITNLTPYIILDGVLLCNKQIRKKTPRPENVVTSADLRTITTPETVKVIKDYKPYKSRKLYGGAFKLYGKPTEIKPSGV